MSSLSRSSLRPMAPFRPVVLLTSRVGLRRRLHPDDGVDALGRDGRSNLLGELHAHAAHGYVRQRCRLLLRPTSDDRDTWAASITHIALEGRCFVLSACQYLTRSDFPEGLRNALGAEPGRVLMRGGCLIVSPLGRVLAGPMWEQEGVLAAECLELVKRFFGQRR